MIQKMYRSQCRRYVRICHFFTFCPIFYSLPTKSSERYIVSIMSVRPSTVSGCSSMFRSRTIFRKPLPNKHETLNQCCLNVGPPSSASALHYNNIGLSSRVCWVDGLFSYCTHKSLRECRCAFLSLTFDPFY